MRTALCDRLGIDVPIIQAPMADAILARFARRP
jgi:NAD(P)H-dependent flavin oxidoreductase YrpB (nitropropane dioxygenase family)